MNTHMEKLPLNKNLALTNGVDMDVRVVGTSNQSL